MDPLFLALAWTAESDDVSARFGQAVASAGDVNGDGFADVVVGALLYGPVNGGRASVYLGSAEGLVNAASWSTEGKEFNDNVGSAVASAGDVNGDGFDDLLVGARGNAGTVSLYPGAAGGLSAAPAWTASGELGWSLASAGDVNGDGYDDVIVGLPFFDAAGEDSGRAALYLGSVSGLPASSDWYFNSEQAESSFGWSVASAGDVNGDGFADVIVGAPFFDDAAADGGRVWTFHGSIAGLSVPSWGVGTQQPSAELGTTVASAGDVNHDGFGDVIVGAARLDGAFIDEGAAFVYHGSSAGLATTAAWTSESNQLGARFGYAVSGAGDMTGDGIADVVVGAYRHDNGEFDEGRVSLFVGSESGLTPTAAFTAESDQAGAEFGTSVAAAGDVNGDGFGDLLVGAALYANGETNEGRAFLYEGVCHGEGDDDADGIPDLCDPCPLVFPDADGDGVCTSEDCDDSDPTVYAGAPELCDGQDNSCAGAVPDDELDLDADGVLACAGDCDDADARRSPEQIEVCGDGIDNDCDGGDAPCATTAEDSDCGCGAALGPTSTALLALVTAVASRRRRASR